MATALDLYLPFDSGAGANITEDQWRKMARHFVGTGPLDNEDDEMQAHGDSSGMQVKVKTGKCFMRGHYGENTSEKTLSIAAVGGIPGGQSRLDRVVLRVDFVNDKIEVDVLTGTPAATGSQVAPAVTQSSTLWEVSLATVGPLTNATTTIAVGTVTDDRTLIVAPTAAQQLGRLGSAAVTSTSASITSSEVTLATVTATLATGRKGKLSVTWYGCTNSGGTVMSFRLYQGATQVGELLQTVSTSNTSGGNAFFAEVTGDGSSIAYTLKGINSPSGVGTFTVLASSVHPLRMLLEDIGI